MVDLLKYITDALVLHGTQFSVDPTVGEITFPNRESPSFDTIVTLKVDDDRVTLLAHPPISTHLMDFLTIPVVPGTQAPEFVKKFVSDLVDLFEVFEI